MLKKLSFNQNSNNIKDAVNLINEIVEFLEKEKLSDLYDLFGGIYFLDEKHKEIFLKINNELLFYILKKFYVKAGFFDYYICFSS